MALKKNTVREKYLNLRLSKSPAYISRLSEKIVSAIRNNSVYKKAKTVMLYYPIKNEVNLLGLLKDKKRFFFPVIKDKRIYPAEYNRIKGFRPAQFNIPVPFNKKSYKKKIELLFVPGIAFDRTGKRIGYGGGYYDRFIVENTKNISLKCGISFDFQIVGNFGKNVSGPKLNRVLSEKKKYIFKGEDLV